MRFDPYEVLGVSQDATEEQIREAFRKLAIKHHPDKGGDAAEFHRITDAHRVLSNPESRKDYDEHGFQVSDPKNPEEIAIRIILDMFTGAIDAFVNSNFSTSDTNIVASVKGTIDRAVMQCREKVHDSENRIKKLGKLGERFIIKKNSGLSSVMTIIKAKTKLEENQIDSMNRQIIVFQKAAEVIEDIEWKEDEINMQGESMMVRMLKEMGIPTNSPFLKDLG